MFLYSFRSIMKLNLFPLLCLTGHIHVTILQTVLHNYTLIKSSQTWPVAQNYCRTFYNDLATIVSNDDWVKVMALAKAGTTSQAWVGLYNDINSWRWSFHNVSLISTSFSQWYSGQPDNNNGNESCATIGTSGYWWDFPCANRYPFICYNGNYTGVERFVGVANLQLSWLDAQAYCRQFHTDLASAINATDNSQLGGVASQQGISWFGLYRDTWKWSDGTKASNLTWLPAQPNNYYRPENCGRFNNGPLSDELCTNKYYFFCHTVIPVRNKQVMKLQVLSDGAVFDPTVQFMTLELIKQKLKEHGMFFNSTVHFRVLPDGNIFYKKRQNNP
ncbi:C-type mannose receptor 2-like isoform X2 [Ictalurus furcatus]|uniref:C-type mannose receptor 2-like isoform X2 n=1 Tax=Ictalurus furcatus TaxID=66913 RepID=UPI0023503042|nr:C-type mannose receptor 2-like isoform X2 [Ictalurus furcatus]